MPSRPLIEAMGIRADVEFGAVTAVAPAEGVDAVAGRRVIYIAVGIGRVCGTRAGILEFIRSTKTLSGGLARGATLGIFDGHPGEYAGATGRAAVVLATLRRGGIGARRLILIDTMRLSHRDHPRRTRTILPITGRHAPSALTRLAGFTLGAGIAVITFRPIFGGLKRAFAVFTDRDLTVWHRLKDALTIGDRGTCLGLIGVGHADGIDAMRPPRVGRINDPHILLF